MNSKYVIIFLTSCFVLGVILQKVCFVTISFGFGKLLCIILISIFIQRYIFTGALKCLLLGILFVILGCHVTVFYKKPDLDIYCTDDITHYYVKSLVTQKLTKKWNKCEMLLLQLHTNKEDIIVKQYIKIQVIVYNNHENKTIHYGDVFRITGRPQKIYMDTKYRYYQEFLHENGVFFQQFVYPKNIRFIACINDNCFTNYFVMLYFFLYERLLKFIKNNEVRYVLATMLLGPQNEKDDTIAKIYTKAGVIHALAISGIHMNIILKCIQYLLSPFILFPSRCVQVVKMLVTVISIWIYLIIIKCPPSALRATIMSTYLLICQITYNQYSTIISAFVSLLFTSFFLPSNIFNIGAQLSYAALFSILSAGYFLQKIKLQFTIGRFLIENIIVSIFITFFTAPISIYYFHSVPLCSCVSNIIMVPSVFIIITTGLMIIMSSCINCQLQKLLSYVITYFILGVNTILRFISSLKYCVMYF